MAPLFHAHRSIPPARAGDIIGRSSDLRLKYYLASSRFRSDIYKAANRLQLRVQCLIFTGFPYSPSSYYLWGGTNARAIGEEPRICKADFL